MQTQSIHLEPILRAAWDECLKDAPNKNTLCNWQVLGRAVVSSDETLLRMVFRNLLSNSLAHGDAGKSIEVDCDVVESMVRVRIRNCCEQLDVAMIPRFTERFYQQDTSRSGTGQRSGHGLSICTDILKRLRGSLKLEEFEADVLQATVLIPCGP